MCRVDKELYPESNSGHGTWVSMLPNDIQGVLAIIVTISALQGDEQFCIGRVLRTIARCQGRRTSMILTSLRSTQFLPWHLGPGKDEFVKASSGTCGPIWGHQCNTVDNESFLPDHFSSGESNGIPARNKSEYRYGGTDRHNGDFR